MIFIQFDKLQYSFFLSFGIHLVNNVSDQSQVSISADKSFGFQSRSKTFLVGRFSSGDKKSVKNRPIFYDTRQIFVGRYCRPTLSADFYRSCVMGLTHSDMDHTVLPANNTISAFTLPVAEHHRPLISTHCAYPRTDGQAELIWVVG